MTLPKPISDALRDYSQAVENHCLAMPRSAHEMIRSLAALEAAIAAAIQPVEPPTDAEVEARARESDARCMAKYYSLGHKQEMECQMPSGHVGMHSMAWDGKTCQWTNGGA